MRVILPCIRGRRNVMAAAAAVVLAPLLSNAEPPGKRRYIGFLSPANAFKPESEQVVWAPLRKLGWREGVNLVIERRFAAGQTELLAPMARQLVKQAVEIIIAHGSIASLAAKSATTTIPIVIHRSGDPVAMGLAASLSRPGGNITGTSTVSPELDVKRLELVRELLPRAKRIGEMLYSPNPLSRVSKGREELYRSLNFTPIFVNAADVYTIEPAVDEVARQGGEALLLAPEALFLQNYQIIRAAALRWSMPVIAGSLGFMGDGALMAYGASDDEHLENLAAFVDQILRGAKPGDLPIRLPTRFELGIDVTAARAIGVTVPQSLLVRADVVFK